MSKGGVTPAAPAAGAAAGAAPTAPDWDKIAGALGKLNLGGASGGADDSKYLRIAAQPAPMNPGGGGLSSLLATLIAMHRNANAGPQSMGGAPSHGSLLG